MSRGDRKVRRVWCHPGNVAGVKTMDKQLLCRLPSQREKWGYRGREGRVGEGLYKLWILSCRQWLKTTSLCSPVIGRSKWGAGQPGVVFPGGLMGFGAGWGWWGKGGLSGFPPSFNFQKTGGRSAKTFTLTFMDGHSWLFSLSLFHILPPTRLPTSPHLSPPLPLPQSSP